MALHASQIEWTGCTWNPLTGCTKISAGCQHCYAERLAKRLHAMGSPSYRNEFRLTLHPHLLEAPLKWKKPRVVFVNSMSDMFHRDVPDEYIQRIFAVMKQASHHVFQSLTKRTHRLVRISPSLPWPENVWMGTTVEHGNYLYRIDHLRQCGAGTRFLSMEPLLGPVPGHRLGYRGG